jgi:hypothetical protein
MKLHDIYEKAYKAGIKNDPRDEKDILKNLENKKSKYEKIKDEDKIYHSKEELYNPYHDTRVLHGKRDREIKGNVLVGIDMGSSELLLADRLKDKKMPISLVIAHHPQSKSLINLNDVMEIQAEIWYKLGVPINVAEKMIAEKSKEIKRSIMPRNADRDRSIAKLLDMPYMCIHTPADNMVVKYLQDIFDNEKPYRLKDILDILNQIEEYKYAKKNHRGPSLLVGSNESRCGKIFVDMTGGTEGPVEIYQELRNVGVGTIVGMHFSESHRKEIMKNKLNCIIAGHISSDTLGMNLILDEIFKDNKDEINIVDCSGFKRYPRW